nr:PQQ-dependent sugar dehydrogenase [uncultured Carboxylicivirga sp.]
MKKIVLPAILLLTVVGFIWLKPTEQSKSPSQEAAALFKSYCLGCHNEQKSPFTNRKWFFGNSKEEIFNSIKNGRQAYGMPSFADGFSDDQISGLTNYIIHLSEQSKHVKVDVKELDVQHSEVQDFIIETVVDGLDIPWGLEFLPNGDMLINERSGQMIRYTKTGEKQLISGLPSIVAQGQGGLLDIELHPDYNNNGWLYFSYSSPNKDNPKLASTAIMRARLQGNELVDKERIFLAMPQTETRHHYGSKLEFDNDGYLFFSVGDRGNRDRHPQYLDNDCGKIHRINDDGTVPEDNPFVGIEDTRPTIFSYGHRNPQGVCMNPETGQIWTDEHGPKGGDELNLIKKGANYGWPVISFGINYNGTTFTNDTAKAGMQQPIVYWVPSIAPCGMTFVKGDKYPKWKNNILTGSLSFHYLHRIVLDGDKVVHQERLLENIGRVRNVEMSPDGFIYVAIEKPGKILKLIPQ